MKRLFAILLGSMFVWMQTVAALPSLVAGGSRAACDCVGCGPKCCCVTPTSPDSKPAPATPARTAAQNELPIFSATSLAWTLPATEAQHLSPDSASQWITATVPLFKRHCALLI